MESKLKIIDTSHHELLNDPVFIYKMTRGKTTVSVNKLDDDQLDQSEALGLLSQLLDKLLHGNQILSIVKN